VHPVAEVVDGVRCYSNLKTLPEPVGGVIICVPPDQAVTAVREAAEAGIRHVWLQQGAESPYVARLLHRARPGRGDRRVHPDVRETIRHPSRAPRARSDARQAATLIRLSYVLRPDGATLPNGKDSII